MMYQGILHRWITYPIHSHHNHKDIVLDIRHANNSLHFSLTTITSYRLLGLSVYKKVVIIISGDYRKRGDCKTNSPKLILGMQSHSESITISTSMGYNTLYTQTNDGDDVAKLSVVASKDVKKGHGMFSCFIHQLHII